MTNRYEYSNADDEHLGIELVQIEGGAVILISGRHGPYLSETHMLLSLDEARTVHRDLGGLIAEGYRLLREAGGPCSEEQTDAPSSGDRSYQSINRSMTPEQCVEAFRKLEERWDDLMKEASGIMDIAREEKP